MTTNPNVDSQGYHLEVLGTCMTNERAGSQHDHPVDAKYLWSYAQEEALVAVSEQGSDKCWRLITDPERRAKRIAARYADLYFRSAEKSHGNLQLYWPALAAFVVKDIVEAYRYSREAVLNSGWSNLARNSDAVALISEMAFGASPYAHALRVYAALAKGNLWLFMDIYPWLWYVLEYGLNKDGSINAARMTAHAGERNAATFQVQSRKAVEELPFGANWFGRWKARAAADPVYAHASSLFSSPPAWVGIDGGYGQHAAAAFQAHAYVKQHVKEVDSGYRMPPSRYWGSFKEAYYVMDEERRELTRVANDGAAAAALRKVAQFKVTDAVRTTYAILIDEHRAPGAGEKFRKQNLELIEIAKQEQLNVLQPLIYEDAELKKTMDANHAISRRFPWISPRYEVVYSAAPHTDAPALKSTFDPPTGFWNQVGGSSASLPNQSDRMAYVGQIARRFNGLMERQRPYMEGELAKIRGWLNA